MNHRQAISQSLRSLVGKAAQPPPQADFHTAFPKLLSSRRDYSKIARFALKFAQFGALDISVGRAVHVLDLPIVPRWWGMKIAGLRHGVAMEVVTTQNSEESQTLHVHLNTLFLKYQTNKHAQGHKSGLCSYLL